MAEDLTKPPVISTADIKPTTEPPRNPAGGRHYGLQAETAKYTETINPIAREERKD